MMFPRSPAKAAQLVVIMLLISFVLTLLLQSVSNLFGVAIFVAGAALFIWLWHLLKLQQYFFGD